MYSTIYDRISRSGQPYAYLKGITQRVVDTYELLRETPPPTESE
mgnify:CR=1 FL=1